MKTLKKYLNMLKCNHRFIPAYQLAAVTDLNNPVYVSICKCGRHEYKSRKKVLRDGRNN